MARIRTVKPEFWASEQILDLSIPARLLFVGLWNFCDDAGIHPASPRTLKAEVFPADDVNVLPLIEEIKQQGLIAEYEVHGKPYWNVTGWHHQKIDRPTFKYLLPNGTVPRSHEDVRRVFVEYSSKHRRVLPPGREGNIRETIVKESIGEEGRGLEGRGPGKETIPPPPPPEGEPLFSLSENLNQEPKPNSIFEDVPVKRTTYMPVTILGCSGKPFVITADMMQDFAERYPSIENIQRECHDIALHLASRGKGLPKAEIPGFLENWLRTADNHYR